MPASVRELSLWTTGLRRPVSARSSSATDWRRVPWTAQHRDDLGQIAESDVRAGGKELVGQAVARGVGDRYHASPLGMCHVIDRVRDVGDALSVLSFDPLQIGRLVRARADHPCKEPFDPEPPGIGSDHSWIGAREDADGDPPRASNARVGGSNPWGRAQYHKHLAWG